MIEITFDVSKELFEKEAILETAHSFMDRYYVDIIEGMADMYTPQEWRQYHHR